MQSQEQQRALFDAFGFLQLPGLVAGEIDWITAEFESVFTGRGIAHDGTKRSCIVPFIDQRARLCTLLDHPGIRSVAENLLGHDFNYLGGDGNYYTGDTGWHSDGGHTVLRYLKIAFYLDPVTRDTGALRVIPGSHVLDHEPQPATRGASNSRERWGIEMKDVPCVALESKPGDVVVFNHNIMHSSFGGSGCRRMFTINLCGHCHDAAQLEDMKSYIAGHDRFWLESLHGAVMRETAGPERRRNLQQVAENEGHLAPLSGKARGRMPEPARG